MEAETDGNPSAVLGHSVINYLIINTFGKDMIQMKSRKTVMMCTMMAGALIAGSSLTAFAADTVVPVANEPSVSVSENTDAEHDDSETDSSTVPEKTKRSRHSRNTIGNSDEENSNAPKTGHHPPHSSGNPDDVSDDTASSHRHKPQQIESDSEENAQAATEEDGSAKSRPMKKVRRPHKSASDTETDTDSSAKRNRSKPSSDSEQTPSESAADASSTVV